MNNIENEMLNIAVEFLNRRFGNRAGGVAVMRTESGEYLTSVSPDVPNASVELCAETGAICDAHKLNVRVTHSLCLMRDTDNGEPKILTPCGVCQERLFYWGGNVLCAITNPENHVIFKTLSEIQPFYWLKQD